MKRLTLLEKMFLNGMEIWIPEGNTKTLKELLTEPLDVLYVTRKQTERKEEANK